MGGCDRRGGSNLLHTISILGAADHVFRCTGVAVRLAGDIVRFGARTAGIMSAIQIGVVVVDGGCRLKWDSK